MTPSGPGPSWIRLAPLAAGLLAAAVYVGALRNGFTFDDPLIVVENPVVTGDGTLAALFTSHYWASEERRGNLYRPLTMATYWLNYRLAGRNPFIYHLVNLVLHGVVASLVYLLFARLALVESAPPGPGARAEVLPAIGAALFAVHPIHSEAVVSVVGRAELLAALFILAAWCLRERAWVCSALFACGLLSKENAVVLPGLLVVEDLLRRRFLRPLRTYLALGATLAAYLAIRAAALWPAAGPVEGPFTSATAAERVLTAVGVLGRYVWMMIWPARLSADYSYNEIPVISSPGDPVFLTGAFVAGGCALAAWAALRRMPLMSAGIAIFFVALSPVCNLFFGIGVIMGERLLYLPSTGLCLSAAVLIEWVARRGAGAARRPWLEGALCVTLTAMLAVPGAARAAWRTGDWFDQLSLFEATVRTSPGSALAWLNLGATYQALGRLQEAEAAYRRTIEIAPDRPGPHFNLASLLEGERRVEEAITLYRDALRIDPDDFRVLNNLGRALTGAGRGSEAVPILEKAVTLRPGAPTPKVNLAAAYLQAGNPILARKLTAEVLADHPDDPAARRLMEAIAADDSWPLRER